MSGAVDRKVIESLRELGKEESADLVTELVDMFLYEAPLLIAGIKIACFKRDAATVRGHAHRLKGFCLNLGANGLADLCGAMEKDAEAERLDVFDLRFRELETLFDKVRVELLAEQAPRPRARVLVAEDNPVNQRVLFLHLSHLGCDVMLVGNGQEAVDAVASKTFDLVFMDCQMPVLDGYSATEIIRKTTGGKLPVIGVGADSTPENQRLALTKGMDDFMGKPVTKLALSRVLEKWLSND